MTARALTRAQRARLDAALAAFRGRAYDAATCHCGHLANAALIAVAGRDLIAEVSPGDDSRAGIEAAIAAAGIADYVALLDDRLEGVAPAMAGDGDLGGIYTDDGPALGVFDGTVLFVLGWGGLGSRPRTEAVRAWRNG